MVSEKYMRLFSKFVKWPPSVRIGNTDHAFTEYPKLPEEQRIFSVQVAYEDAKETVAALRELADDIENLIR